MEENKQLVNEDSASPAESQKESATNEIHHGEHGHHHHHSHGHHHGSHSHGHSHSHHRHSSSHGGRSSKHGLSRGERKVKENLKKWIRKHKNILINVLFCSISLFLLVLLAYQTDIFHAGSHNSSLGSTTGSTIRMETTLFTDDITLVHDAVLNYTQSDSKLKVQSVYEKYNGADVKLNDSLPLTLAYAVNGLPKGVEITAVRLDLYETVDFQNGITYYLGADATTVDVYNLKTGVTYYYRWSLTLNVGGEVGTTGSFVTAESPRMITVDGIDNVRDIGAWKTSDGKVIRQGLLYRGSELDGMTDDDNAVTEKGISQLKLLGIRYEMDLRSTWSGEQTLGENVVQKHFPTGPYTTILKQGNKTTIAKIFAEFAKAENYPMYLHCSYGKDITGTLMYLLGALLGMSDDDLNRDYCLSYFSYASLSESSYADFVEAIQALDGANTQEKVEGYLLSCGVTADEIASIRNLFLGE